MSQGGPESFFNGACRGGGEKGFLFQTPEELDSYKLV